jgi:cobalt-precorrin-5B (C1)-methyltransferase
MLRGKYSGQIAVTLPDKQHYLVIPIQAVYWLDAQSVRAEVIKDAGDDPDNTHGATIFAEVRRNHLNEIRFFAGSGVGTVTQPGLRVAVGEPAINPVPRKMMQQAVMEVLGNDLGLGFDLTIGCEKGESIAQKTFNPKLGIVGGISILGTTGIVEPLSLAAWIASIEVYVHFAMADGASSIAFLPGKIGRSYAQAALGLANHRAVQIANFLGDALDFLQQTMQEQQQQLDTLWLLGHPGKLAKVLAGQWDTHSSKSAMAMAMVAEVARDLGFNQDLVSSIAQANTVEASIGLLQQQAKAQVLWLELECRIAALVHQRIPKVGQVQVRLFNLNGETLGAA